MNEKSILIFTSDFNPTVDKVIDWLSYYKCKVHRINNVFSIDYDIEINNNKKIGTVRIWEYRLEYNNIFGLPDERYKLLLKELIQTYYKNLELIIGYKRFFFSKSKITILEMARDNELKIPDYLVTNNKESLSKFICKHGDIITKPGNEMHTIVEEGTEKRPYTVLISSKDLPKLPDRFGASLFQKLIRKTCDIKVVFVGGESYGQAIFAQQHIETEIDFRVYNKYRSARLAPFKLPKIIENRVNKLLDVLQLKFAVVDFILDEENELYFLEINPDGIFYSISQTGNYFIEQKIAKILSKK